MESLVPITSFQVVVLLQKESVEKGFCGSPRVRIDSIRLWDVDQWFLENKLRNIHDSI